MKRMTTEEIKDIKEIKNVKVFINGKRIDTKDPFWMMRHYKPDVKLTFKCTIIKKSDEKIFIE